MGKAKDNERKLAHYYYVYEGMGYDQIVEKLGIAKQTLANWIKKYNWKQERKIRQTDYIVRLDNIRQMIFEEAEQRLELLKKLKETTDRRKRIEIRQEISRIDDGIAKLNKTLENIDKENKISLGTFARVMREIFEELENYDSELYEKTIPFQQYLLDKIALKYG